MTKDYKLQIVVDNEDPGAAKNRLLACEMMSAVPYEVVKSLGEVKVGDMVALAHGSWKLGCVTKVDPAGDTGVEFLELDHAHHYAISMAGVVTIPVLVLDFARVATSV